MGVPVSASLPSPSLSNSVLPSHHQCSLLSAASDPCPAESGRLGGGGRGRKEGEEGRKGRKGGRGGGKEERRKREKGRGGGEEERRERGVPLASCTAKTSWLF